MAKDNVSPIVESSAESIDKIRDILFGAKITEYEQRFIQLGQRISNENKSLQEDVARQLNRLENDTIAELEKIIQQVTELNNKLSNELAGMHAQLQLNVKQINEHIDSALDGFEKTLNQQRTGLEETKVGRDDLATLFDEVSSRLKKLSKNHSEN